MTTVDIVVVNWNAGSQLRECVESIARSAFSACRLGRVVVVDNASTDDSVASLSTLERSVTLLRNPANVGFAAACNQGAEVCDAEVVLFLNPDARLFPDTLDVATGFLMAHPKAGICGVALEGDDGIVHRTCCRLPDTWSLIARALGLERLSGGVLRSYVMSEWSHDSTRQVEHVIGACYFVRRSLFLELDGFDERFFVYLEDLDFSARSRRVGWECWFLSPPRAYHRGGGTSRRVKAVRLFYSLRSRLQYARKHLSYGGRAAVWSATVLIEPLVRMGAAAGRASWVEVRDTGRGYGMLWRWLYGELRVVRR